MIKFKIDDIPSSNNKYQGQGSKSKAIKDYQQEKKIWSQFIWIQLQLHKKELKDLQLPFNQATIIMRYNFKSKTRRDPDNYSGKMILDGLRDHKIISDDSFKEIDIFPFATFGNQFSSVEIFVLEGKQLSGYVENLLNDYKIL